MSLDSVLSDTWNKCRSHDEVCRPEHTWALCRILTAVDLAEADREHVALREIGPFRLASSPDKTEIVEGFIANALPVVITTLCTGASLEASMTGTLAVAFQLLASLAKRTVRVDDPIAWSVLVLVKERNNTGVHPSATDVEASISPRLGEDVGTVHEMIYRAIAALEEARPLVGRESLSLLARDAQGGLVAKV